MITKDRLKQIGKSILSNAVTSTGFSPKFNELRNIKTILQNQITDQLSPQELQDIVLSKKNEKTIEKLVVLGKRIYNQTPTEEKAYMIAMSIGTIIKEYEWGNDYVTDEGIYRLANRIV